MLGKLFFAVALRAVHRAENEHRTRAVHSHFAARHPTTTKRVSTHTPRCPLEPLVLQFTFFFPQNERERAEHRTPAREPNSMEKIFKFFQGRLSQLGQS